MKPSFENDDKIRILKTEDVDDIQSLCMRCFEFSLLVEGALPQADAGQNILTALPPGKEANDKYVFGVYDGPILIAVIDLIRNYPRDREWYIGLLMIDPQYRAKHLGTTLTNWILNVVSEHGGHQVKLGVVKDNTAGLAFWKKMGFNPEFQTDDETKTTIRLYRECI